MKNHKTLVVDTNIFIHYQFFTDIDWCALADCKKTTILITPTIIKELESLKYENNHRKKERSRNVLNKIEKLLDESSNSIFRNNVDLMLISSEPSNELFKANNLNIDTQDDRILATIIENKPNVSSEIFIVSNDLGIRLKAKALNIKVIAIPEKYELKPEPDKKEKYIARLRNEIAALKSPLAKVAVYLDRMKETREYTISKPKQLKKDLIKKKCEEIKLKHPKKEYSSEDILENQFNLISGITEKKIEEYNTELDSFYNEYEQFCIRKLRMENRKLLSLKLNMIVMNEGKSPAEDIDIYFHFPDGFEIFMHNDFETEINEPEAPKLKGIMDGILASESLLHNLTSPLLNPNYQHLSLPSNVSSFNIIKSKSYEIELSISRLKHYQFEKLDSLYLVFDSFEQARSFSFSYKIQAANIPEELEGKLNIIIKKDS